MIETAQILDELQTIAAAGGWILWALLALAFAIAWSLLGLHRALSFPDASLLAPRTWARLLRDPRASGAPFEELAKTLAASDDPARRLEEAGHRLFARSRRRFPFAFTMIGAAPLLGLLGTVAGMLATFEGMAASAARAPIDTISDGIFKALVTTETGLVIGVPTFIVCSFLKSRHDALELRFQQLASRLLRETAPATRNAN